MTKYQKTLLTGAAIGIAVVGIAARAGVASGVTSAIVPPTTTVGGGRGDNTPTNGGDNGGSWWQFWK